MGFNKIKRKIAGIVALLLTFPLVTANASVDNNKVKYGEKYEVRSNVTQSRAYSTKKYSNNIDDERIEVQQKTEAIKKMSLLVPKTNSNFEIAYAHENGEYTFVEGVDDIKEAMDKVDKLPIPYANDNVIPVVISSSGSVVYSTNGLGRVIKYINHKPYAGSDIVTDLYSNPGLTSSDNYINHKYIEDVPVLLDNGVSAKIYISGYEGWINKNTSSGNFDLEIVPLNQVKNPSYYYVESGVLLHYISSDLKGSTGNTIQIGKAPTYLKSGVKYLSYDGNYFYNGSDIQGGLSTLLADYKQGIRTSSVNPNNPYYAYFNILPFRSETTYTAAQLDKFINENTKSNSKLRGLGATFKDAERKYGVNALLSLGVAMNESAGGTSDIALSKNNLFGLKAIDSAPGLEANEFATPADSVYDFTKNYISRGYANPSDWRYYGGLLGNKKLGANVKYASDPFWGEKAASYAFRVDKHLSNSLNELNDWDRYQIATTKSPTNIINDSNGLLYSIVTTKSTPNGLVEVPFIISALQKFNILGKEYYQILPERNTSVTSASNYDGSYNWAGYGYIQSSTTTFLNNGRGKLITPSVVVKAGKDRFATAVELSKHAYNSSNTVVLVNGLVMADGLSATPLAAYHNSPLLITGKDALEESVKNEIKRLGTKKVIIVGGTGVVSSNIEKQLKALGVNTITRLGGLDRFETSLLVAKYIDSNCYDVENIVVTNGMGEADSLSIAPVAGRDRMPIILSPKTALTNNTLSWLRTEGLKNAYIVGGTGVLTNNVLNQVNSITSNNISGNRLAGSDRFETNAKIIEKFYGSHLDQVFITRGIVLADALSSGAVAAAKNGPVILSELDLTAAQKNILKNKGANKIVQVGYGVIPTSLNSLKKCLEYTTY